MVQRTFWEGEKEERMKVPMVGGSQMGRIKEELLKQGGREN
jgi:hypothetical protein